MEAPLVLYHAFIDGLVGRRRGYLADAVREERLRHCWAEQGEEYGELLGSLTAEQREVVARMVQHTRDTAIADVLAYLREQIVVNGIRLYQHGLALPAEPHQTMDSDWWCRCQGEPWPRREGEVFGSGKAD